MEDNSEPRSILKNPKPARELKVEDALLYLDQVKMEFSDKPHIYNEFLEIMKNFKAQSINTPGVIERVKNLFRGYNKLILGFNTFLPEGEGYKIELTAEEQAMSYPGQRVDPEEVMIHWDKGGSGGQNNGGPPRYNNNAPHHTDRDRERQGDRGMGPLPQGLSSLSPHDSQGMRGTTPVPFNTAGGGGGGGLLNTMGGGLISSGMGQTQGPNNPLAAQAGQGQGQGAGQNVGATGPSSQGQQNNQNQGGQNQGPGSAQPPQGQGQGSTYKPPQQMQQQHAIHYVTTIRNRFANEPDTYRSFLKILHTYQKEQRGIKDVLEQVSHLFADHPDLLMEFTYFLPDAVQEQAKERLHRAARESEVRRRMMITKQQQHMSQLSSAPLGGGVSTGPQGNGPQGPPGPQGGKRGRDGAPKETAASRKSAAAAAAAGGPWNMGTNPLPVPSSATTAPTQPKKVARKKNLAASGSAPVTEIISEALPSIAMASLNGQKDGTGGAPMIPKEAKEGHNAAQKEHNSMVKMMKEMSSQQNALSASEKGKDKDKEKKEDFNNSHAHISVTAERKFFDQTKELLTSVSRESWTEFVRCLDLFSCDAVTKKDLFALVQDLFGPANGELFEEFKVLMATRANYTANTSDMWYATPLSEIDFSQCRKCTPSYRALPKSYPKPVCSERSDVEASLLNDVWVGIPIGSEESYSFRFMRKNQYEEALFKCEDDQFEIDMIIDTNTSAIRILEPIAEEIGSLRLLMDSERAAPRFSFQLEKRSLGTVHLNAITRLYGDHATEILDLLRRNPAGTIPVVLKRLKQKDSEWRRARLDLQKQWKETLNRNYEKSFDHRSFYFRQQDKRSYTAKLLVNEIKTQALEPGYSAQDFASAGLSFTVPADKVHLLGNLPIPSASGLPPPISNWSPQLTMSYSTSYQLVHRDVYRVLCHAAECLVSSPTDKERLPALWRDLLRVFFNMPVHYLYGGSTASYAAYGQSDFVTVDPSEAWPEDTKVVTIYGPGTIIKFSSTDSLYQVQLPFGVGYLVPSAILGAEELSAQALHAIGVTEPSYASAERSSTSNSPTPPSKKTASEPAPGVKDPCQLFYGTHWCYLFFRLHHTIFSRLCAARDMSAALSEPSNEKDADGQNRPEEETAGEMDVTIESTANGPTTGTKRHRNRGTKPPYQAFLGQLYALIEGAIDGNRYEDSCRQLLGNNSYILFGLDKLIQQTLKCLQAMTNDESVNKLIGLFVYHKSTGRSNTRYTLSSNGTSNAPSSSFPSATAASDGAMSVDSSSQQDDAEKNATDINDSIDVSEYQAHVSRVLVNFTEDIYRIQLLSLGNFEAENEYQHVACQCLGVLGPGGVPVYSPPAIASIALSSATADIVPSLPLNTTTFASISNITATVYDIAGVSVDDLSTSALEDALLPPPSFPQAVSFPSALSSSLSSSHPSHPSHQTHQSHLASDNMEVIKEEKEMYSRENSDSYWAQDGRNIETEMENKGNSTTQKDDENDMLGDVKEENLGADSRMREEKMKEYNNYNNYNNYEGEGKGNMEYSERDRETDLNMNGEPINVAESVNDGNDGNGNNGFLEEKKN